MSWTKRKLGELIENFSIKAKDYGGSEGLEFLGVSNELGITRSKNAAEDRAEDYKIIEEGCFAYNPYRINVGSIGYLDEDIKGLISPAYVVFKVKEDQIIPELLLKFLKSDEGLHQIKINARGTVRQALRFEDLSNIDISLPDIEAQKIFFRRILKIEEKSRPIAENLNNQLELIRNLRMAFLREAMQGKLVEQNPKDEPASVLLEKIKAEKEGLIKQKKIKKLKSLEPISDHEIPFEIPKNWIWCRLGDITLLSEAGKSYSAKDVIADKNEWAVIKTSAITSGEFLENENKLLPNQNIYYEKIKINQGDILFCRASGSKGLAGKSCVVESEPKAKLILSDKSIRFILSNHVQVKFIHLYNISSLSFKYYNVLGTGKSTSMNNITRDQFNNLPVPLPPTSEQILIVSAMNKLKEYCNELESRIIASQQYNELILQQSLREALGLKFTFSNEPQPKPFKDKAIASKYDSNTLLMEIQELLKIHGKIHALDLWQMSKFYGKTDEDKNIDGFYAELKILIEKDKTVKETEKGYLELV